MMASRVMFVLAVFLTSFFEIQVLAQNSTTGIAPSPTVSSSGAASPTPGMSHSASTPSGAASAGTLTPTPTITVSSTVLPLFETKLIVKATLEGECKNNTKADIKNWIKSEIYKVGYNVNDIKVIATPRGNNCTVNITVEFEKGLTKNDIVEKFTNASKKAVNGVKITVDIINVDVAGVTFGEYKPSDADCKAKCCDGGGGPIEVKRTCKPKYKCANIKDSKTAPDCSKVCPKCSAGMSLQVSLMMLIFAGLLNWFLKE